MFLIVAQKKICIPNLTVLLVIFQLIYVYTKKEIKELLGILSPTQESQKKLSHHAALLFTLRLMQHMTVTEEYI